MKRLDLFLAPTAFAAEPPIGSAPSRSSPEGNLADRWKGTTPIAVLTTAAETFRR